MLEHLTHSQLIDKILEQRQMLSNLLAVIHRDGGHYEYKYGTTKAVADAELKVARMVQLADLTYKTDKSMVIKRP